MWNVVVILVIVLLGGIVAYLLWRQLNNQMTTLVKTNQETLSNINEMLDKAASQADAQNKVDQDHAKTITSGKDAADFLNGVHDARGGSTTQMRAAGRAKPACFVGGFGRG